MPKVGCDDFDKTRNIYQNKKWVRFHQKEKIIAQQTKSMASKL